MDHVLFFDTEESWTPSWAPNLFEIENYAHPSHLKYKLVS